MSFKKLVEQAMTHGADAVIAEKSPPGFKGTVKAMKDEGGIDNPYALGWWMKNKGYKSHKKADGTAKNESIRIEHPVHGTGTVQSITESNIEITWDNLDKRLSAPTIVAFSEAKYLTRLAESKPVKESKKPMKKRQAKKITESTVAVGMAAVGGTHRGTEVVEDDLEILRFDDLLSEDDDWKKPWEEDDSDDSDSGDTDSSRSENMDGDQHGLRDAEDTREYDGADYTNVPRPSDSVLTNQEDQPEYNADPLATMAGFDAATDGDEPDGDYQTDLLPVDAPDTPQVRDLEGSSDRGNTRDAGDDSDDTSEVDAGDYDESKPEDNDGGENEMSKKNESAWLDMADLGLELNEMSDPMGGMDFDQDMDEMGHGMQEHAMGEGEVAFTKDFLHTLLKAVAGQAPDESKLEALCQGLQSAQSDKGDAGLDESDWDAIKSAAASAYSGGGDDMGGEPDMGGDDMDDMGEEPEYEDRAEGDGEPAGPEGGPEHEGKTKMMDTVGDESDDDDLDESKGGTPVGTGNTSGSGGGNQQDLSKPKAYHGKPVGTGTSGPGGSSADEYGQKPQKDGGSNLLPAYEKGKQNGAHGTNFDGKAESPAPRRSKPLAAEGRKGKKKDTRLDEAIMLGMSGIPGTDRGTGDGVPEGTDWDEEMNLIRRRAGIVEWWKDE